MIKTSLLLAIAAQNPNGFTFNLVTNQMQENGFAVARKETQNSFGAEGAERCLEFCLNNDVTCVGGWLDSVTGKYYFDSTEIYYNKLDALRAGAKNAQLAVFDLNNLQEIRL